MDLEGDASSSTSVPRLDYASPPPSRGYPAPSRAYLGWVLLAVLAHLFVVLPAAFVIFDETSHEWMWRILLPIQFIVTIGRMGPVGNLLMVPANELLVAIELLACFEPLRLTAWFVTFRGWPSRGSN